MAQSELKKLQELGDSLRAGNGSDGPDVLLLREEITRECARVKEAMNHVVFSQAKENLTERYIRFHQAGVIRLTDQLQSYFSENGDADLQLATGFFIAQLFDLLTYAEHYFPRYFDTGLVIPESYRLVALKQLSGPVAELAALAEGRLESPALKDCLRDYLGSFGQDNFPERLTFRDVSYLRLFLKETEQLFRSTGATARDCPLSQRLVYLNFNHLGFFTYWQEMVRADLKLSGSDAQYLAVLTGALSHIKSLQSKPGCGYHPDWPGIKTMLESWLTDEIALFGLREKTLAAALPETEANDKVVLGLSVAHIACITRLFYEENCYRSASVTDILKFTVRHYRSKRQEHISHGSLSKEYYGVTQVTAAVVRDLLQKMVNRINKTYFPVWFAIGAAYLC